MGDVGNFFLGGSKQKSKANNWYENESANQSTQQSTQGSANASQNFQKSGNQQYNRGYDAINAAFAPALNYTTAAGNAMAALLGLPQQSYSYKPTKMPDVMPSGGSAGDLQGLAQLVSGVMPKPTANAPTSPAVPPPAPVVPPSAPAPSTPSRPPSLLDLLTGGGGARSAVNFDPTLLPEQREAGGPVEAGKPYIVGERRPELFVPNQNGTILPRVPRTRGGGKDPTVPGTPPTTIQTPAPSPAANTVNMYTQGAPATGDALQNWSDSAGMNFILDQGQKAVSGASAASGVFNSGATGKALTEYGQNLGKTYLGEYMNNLLKLGQLGLGAGSGIAGAGGMSVGQSIGGGTSLGTSFGQSSGQSSGYSLGSGGGTSSGSGNSKNGLLPALASFAPKGG